jgi:hypothetical protein
MWLTDAEFGEFLDCCTVITGMMPFDYQTAVPWLPEWRPLIIGLPSRDYRNDFLWLLDCLPVITGMISFDYWTALPCLPELCPLIIGLLSCDYRNDVLLLLDCYPVITGMMSFYYWTAIPWLPELCPFIIGLLSRDYRNGPFIIELLSRDYRTTFLYLLDCCLAIHITWTHLSNLLTLDRRSHHFVLKLTACSWVRKGRKISLRASVPVRSGVTLLAGAFLIVVQRRCQLLRLFSVGVRMNEYGAVVEWYWRGKTEVLGENPVSATLCQPQIPHKPAWDRSRPSATRCQQLTAWTMAQPCERVGEWVNGNTNWRASGGFGGTARGWLGHGASGRVGWRVGGHVHVPLRWAFRWDGPKTQHAHTPRQTLQQTLSSQNTLLYTLTPPNVKPVNFSIVFCDVTKVWTSNLTGRSESGDDLAIPLNKTSYRFYLQLQSTSHVL